MKKLLTVILLLTVLTSYGQQKDPAYWNHIYHPNRLILQKTDTIITGTVLKEIKEQDGDYHIQVQTNKGVLNIEIICAFPDKETICAGYNNVIPKPKKGDKVQVKGDYCFDNKHKWYEIHPVKSIKVL
jgi:hypothetical protein